MNGVYISMLVFAFIGAITPGPVNIIATSTGANFGFARALPHVVGASVAYTLVVFLSGIGLSSMLLANPAMAISLQYLGAVFLLYMSYKIASAKPFESTSGIATKPPGLLSGMLVQGLNPKAWLVAMSGVSLFVIPYQPMALQLAVFCIISLVICFLCVGIWALSGQLISKYLANERRQLVFNITMGLLLSSTVITFFVERS